MRELGSTWDERYGQLLAFKERMGHCRVPKEWRETPELGGWVIKQRMDRRRGTLLTEREERLDAIDFDLVLLSIKIQCLELQEYQIKHLLSKNHFHLHQKLKQECLL